MELSSTRTHMLERLEGLSWLGPLLARLTVGTMFATTGWGKLHSIPGVTGFFTELGIPAPGFHAYLVAITEFAGGVALLAGLATRLASIPLAIVMVVAIITAKLGDIDGLTSFLALEEFTYFCVLCWLAIAGPGKASLDDLLVRRTSNERQRRSSATGENTRAAT